MFKLTYNLAVPVGTVIGTAKPNFPINSNKWFIPLSRDLMQSQSSRML